MAVGIFKLLFGLKNIFTPNPPLRERLKALYRFESDKALYTIFETQTIEKDCVNIEIEENRDGKRKLILKNEIFEDSWGTMGGDSFYSLMRNARVHLIYYITNKKEIIIKEEELFQIK